MEEFEVSDTAYMAMEGEIDSLPDSNNSRRRSSIRSKLERTFNSSRRFSQISESRLQGWQTRSRFANQVARSRTYEVKRTWTKWWDSEGYAVVTEFVATMIFQLICGDINRGIYTGFFVMVAIFVFGDVSGAHMNPSITVSLLVADEFPPHRAATYIVAQLVGAAVGALLSAAFFGRHFLIGKYSVNRHGLNFTDEILHYSYSPSVSTPYPTPVPGPSTIPASNTQPALTRLQMWHANGCFVPYFYDKSNPLYPTGSNRQENYSSAGVLGQVWLAEFIGTAMLLTSVYQAFLAKPALGRNLGPVLIGFAVWIVVDTFGVISGAAINPARFFGPAIVYGCGIDLMWLYYLAEISASILTGLGWKYVQKPWQERREARRKRKGKAKATWASCE